MLQHPSPKKEKKRNKEKMIESWEVDAARSGKRARDWK